MILSIGITALLVGVPIALLTVWVEAAITRRRERRDAAYLQSLAPKPRPRR